MQKFLILITGIPASGKTFLSNVVSHELFIHNLVVKTLSIDSLEELFNQFAQITEKQIQSLLQNANWDSQLKNFVLDKRIFNQKAWNQSRNLVGQFSTLNIFFNHCQVLIIEDELPLRSQRKPFRRFCSKNQFKYLQIQIDISITEALKNNIKRGEQNPKFQVSEQIIKKSFNKFQQSEDSMLIPYGDFSVLKYESIMAKAKNIQILDNYTEFLEKQDKFHQYTSKEMDENELRKLISNIIKDEKYAKEFIPLEFNLSNRQKSQLLSECKKVYLERKRKIDFKSIVKEFINKKKQLS